MIASTASDNAHPNFRTAMMAWNAYVLLGAIVGSLLAGMLVQDCIRSNKRSWRLSLSVWAGIILLLYADSRYGLEPTDDYDGALIVDTWTGRKVGLLFDASRDAQEGRY